MRTKASRRAIDRAEAWLKTVAPVSTCDADIESLIYLHLRGQSAITGEALKGIWHREICRSILRRASDFRVSDTQLKRMVDGIVPWNELIRIEGRYCDSVFDLLRMPDGHWLTHPSFSYRAIECLRVEGLETWQKWAIEDFLQNFAESPTASLLVFSWCRSDRAIASIGKERLEHLLKQITYRSGSFSDRTVEAGYLLFVCIRAGLQAEYSEAIDSTAKMLLDRQLSTGAWAADDREADPEGNLIVTLSAVHGLAVTKPRDGVGLSPQLRTGYFLNSISRATGPSRADRQPM